MYGLKGSPLDLCLLPIAVVSQLPVRAVRNGPLLHRVGALLQRRRAAPVLRNLGPQRVNEHVVRARLGEERSTSRGARE